MFLATPASATADTHTICHATDSETNPFVTITIAKAAVYNGHLGADHHNATDIIPPFTYNDQEYSQNFDEAGQATFENDCQAPGSETSTSSSTSETTTSDTDTTTTQVPVFGSVMSMVLGVGGALGGALLMLRRRL